MLVIAIVFALIVLYFYIRPYTRRYDTVVAYTGGLGTGKSFLSAETVEVLYKKAVFRTKLYNLFHRKKNRQPIPEVYSSIPISFRVGFRKRKYSLVLRPEHLTLQRNIVPGSVVYLDEIDVFCNQFGLTNPNIIEMSTKKDVQRRKLEAVHDIKSPDSGLVDEEIRLFRHLFSNHTTGVEAKLVCNSQATSNIVTVIRRRMNTVFVLSTFRKWGLPFCRPFFYTVKCRNITITDEITNMAEENAEDNMRIIIGFFPRRRRYDTHCYRGRAETIPFVEETRWSRLQTERLMQCPVDDLYNKSKTEVL